MPDLLNRHRWLTPLLLFVLVVLLLKPAVLPQHNTHALDGNDFTGNFYPLYGYTAELVREGTLPLWNPRQFIGFPVAGNPQAAIFYPGTWAIWGLNAWFGVSVPRAIGVMVVLHVFFAAWGVAVFTRQMGASATGSLAAAIIYAMSGWAAARIFAGHYTIITVFAWMPWVFAGYWRGLNLPHPPAPSPTSERGSNETDQVPSLPAGRGFRGGVNTLIAPTAALGMAALAGHPQMVLYTVLGLVVIWGYRVYSGETDFWAGLWRLAVISIGGVILGAALIIPTAELVQYSPRTDASLEFVNNFALPPSQLVTLALPYFYGNPKVEPSYYWGTITFEEMTAYAGLLPLIALFLAFRLKNRHAALWIAFVVMGIVLSLGADGVLFALLVRWIPGFNLFRSPGRFLYFVTLGLAGLTALLITHLETATSHRRQVTLAPTIRAVPYLALMLFAFSVFFGGWFASASHVEPMPHRAQQLAGVTGYAAVVMLAVWGVLFAWTRSVQRAVNTAVILTLLLITWDAWRVAIPIITTSDVTAHPLWNGAAANVPTDADARTWAFVDPNNYYPDAVNNASLTGHLGVLGYDPLEIADFSTFLQSAGSDPNNPLNQLIGLKYLLSWEPREHENFDLIGIADGGIYYENNDPFPRTWIAQGGELQPNDEIVRQMILNREIEARETVILDRSLACELGEEGGSAKITDYGANHVSVDVSSDGGVLVLSDQYYPGWAAAVDGETVNIRRAYTILRAVCVPPGDHTVTFDYRPQSVMIGAVISAVGWLILAIMGLISWRATSSLPR